MPFQRAYGHQRRLRGLGDGDNAADCQAQADSASAPLDAQMEALGENWKVVSNYNAADMQQIYDQTVAILNKALIGTQSFVTTESPIASEVPDWAKQANDLGSYVTNALVNGVKYSTAITAAANAGVANPVIAAPDFKHWVLTSLGTASSAVAGIAFLSCYSSFAATLLETIKSEVLALFNFVVNVVEGVGKIVATVAGAIDTLIKVVGWIAVGLAGLFAWNFYSAHKQRAAEVEEPAHDTSMQDAVGHRRARRRFRRR